MKTIALSNEQYHLIIDTINQGFVYNDVSYRPNNRVSTALVLEANLGLRISDIVKLKLSDIVKDGNRYRLDIVEQKTSKTRTFTVPDQLYNYMLSYALDNKISKTARLIPITERAVQKHLKAVCEYLQLENISTHSFRKMFATTTYINSGYNIEVTRTLLQHTSSAITQRYIGIQQKQIEDALEGVIDLI